MQRFWNSIWKMRSIRKKIALIEKKYRHSFAVYVLIYQLPKFGGNGTNSLWVLALNSVRFKWKKRSRESRAKYVTPSGNFQFRPKRKSVRHFSAVGLLRTLTEKSKFKENCRSEGIRLPTDWSFLTVLVNARGYYFARRYPRPKSVNASKRLKYRKQDLPFSHPLILICREEDLRVVMFIKLYILDRPFWLCI